MNSDAPLVFVFCKNILITMFDHIVDVLLVFHMQLWILASEELGAAMNVNVARL